MRETLLDRRQKLDAAVSGKGVAAAMLMAHLHLRVIEQVRGARDPRPDALLGRCLDDLYGFRAGASQRDDVTLMLLRRSE